MTLLILSFVAGVLTVLAPCILPLLPIIIGGSVGDTKRKPWVIILSLAASIILFTLLLKASTALIAIPQSFWTYFSGIIITVFGLITLFPGPWEKLSAKFALQGKSNGWLQKSAQNKGKAGDILLGVSLGPVFSSCSPTYFLILGTVLPQSFSVGLVYLIAYAAGLALVLFLIAFLGQKIIQRLKPAADAHGWFKKALGILFIIVGVAIMLGLDKDFETYIVQQGYLDGVLEIEHQLIDSVENAQ